MTESKPVTSWDILKEPNRILLEEDYSKMEIVIYSLSWLVQIGLVIALSVSYLRG